MLYIRIFSFNIGLTPNLYEEPVWPNGWVFVYELSGSEFESSCSHSNEISSLIIVHLWLTTYGALKPLQPGVACLYPLKTLENF